MPGPATGALRPDVGAGEWPEGSFDLILLSEVLYFLSAADIAATAGLVRRSLLPGGVVLLVNWIGNPVPPQPGDEAAEAFLAATDLAVVRQERAEGYGWSCSLIRSERVVDYFGTVAVLAGAGGKIRMSSASSMVKKPSAP